MEAAAEQRIERLKQAAEAGGGDHAGGGAHHKTRGPIGRLLGLIGRTVMLGGTGASIAAAYYTYRYELGEIETIVRETKTKKDNAFLGSEL